MEDPRILCEIGGIASKVAAFIEPVADSLGYRLVRVKVLGSTLQVMAERSSGQFSISDCEQLSREISPLLDLEDFFSGRYHLEVSSPGIDRPLVRKSDFVKAVGHEVKLEFSQTIEGRKRLRGEISRVDETGVQVVISSEKDQENKEISIPFLALSEAKLVLTERLLKASVQEKDPLVEGGIWEETEGENWGSVDIEFEGEKNHHG